MKLLANKVSTVITPLMVILSLLPMLLMGYIAYSVANRILINQINSNMILYEKRKIETIDYFVKERKLDAFQLAGLPEISSYFNANRDKNSDFYGNYMSGFLSGSGFKSLILIKLDGTIIYSSNNKEEIGQSVSAINDYYDAFNVTKILMLPYVSYSFSKYRRSDDRVFITTPVIDKGKMLGVLILSMSKQVIVKVINTNVLDITASSSSGILDNGILKMFSAHNSSGFSKYDEETKSTIMEILKEAAHGSEGIQIISDKSIGDLVAVYRYLPELSMGILTHYEYKRIYNQVIWLKFKILLLMALSIVIVLIISYLISRTLSKSTLATENALLNVLPQYVINEMNTYGYYRPRILENVSIIFIDIVNYSKYALSESPDKLIKVLSDLYTEVDKQSDKYGITKIKTIGDAYMAIADKGSGTDNAESAVKFALACIKKVKIYNIKSDSNFSIRIGINTGQVIAGVISSKRISYDIWGSDVNIAARFETGAKINQILLSQSTYHLLPNPDEYNIIPEKAVPCKGIGDIDAYSLNPEPKEGL